MIKKAVVVGLNYQHPGSPENWRLSGPANDANAIGRLLRERAGFDAVRMLPATSHDSAEVDQQGRLDCRGLEKALCDLFVPNDAGAPDLALFFFAGHGFSKTSTGTSYLVTSDADLSGNWGVSLQDLSQWLAKRKDQKKIIWLDCCHSGALPNLLSAAPENRSACNMLAACREPQAAYELAGRGLLTNALLKAFEEHDGYLDTDLLASAVYRHIDPRWQQPVRSYFGPTIPLIGQRRDAIVAAQRIDTNPYRGLKAFEQEDEALFFGRRTLVQRMVQRLQSAENRFLAVVGASGSGKSSLVQAGLLHQLMKVPPDKDRWLVYRMVPGERPFQRLRDTLVRLSSADVDTLPDQHDAAGWLAESSARIIRARANAQPAPQRLLLFVDQFEELFTQTPTADRERFIACLVNAHQRSDSKLTVVIALRADFYGACTSAPLAGLADLMRDQQINPVPMDEDELREAIAEPARRHGWRVERELENLLIRQTLGDAGRLPLLQHGLTEIWNHCGDSGALTLAAYRALAGDGDLGHVLAKTADKAFEDEDHPQYLNDKEQAAARHLLVRLVHVDTGSDDLRRRLATTDDDIRVPAFSNEVMDGVIRKLSAPETRLLVTDRFGDGDSPMQTVELTHETLIRAWPRLKGWLEEEREFEHWHRRIIDRARDWKAAGEDKEPLLSGRPLDHALDWRKEHALKLNPLVEEYLSRSEATDAENREHKKQERHRRNQEAFDANCLLASVIMELDRFKRADQLLKQCRRGDAGITELHRIKHGLLSAALQLRWAPASEFPVIYDARPAIAVDPQDQRIALADPFNRVLIRPAVPTAVGAGCQVDLDDPATSLAFSPDGDSLLCAQASMLTQRDASTGAELSRCRPKIPEGEMLGQLAVSPDGRRLCVAIHPSTLLVFRFDDSGSLSCRNPLSVSLPDDGTAEPRIKEAGIAFLGNDRLVALTDGGLLSAYDLQQRESVPTPLLGRDVSLTCMAVSPSGWLLVAVDEHRRLRRLALGQSSDQTKSAKTMQPRLAFQPHGLAIAAPDLLLAIAEDGRLHLIDIPSGRTLRKLTGHSAASSVTTVIGSRTGLSADADGKLCRWSVELPNQWTFAFAKTIAQLMVDMENDRLLVGLESGLVVERCLPDAGAVQQSYRINAPTGESAFARVKLRHRDDGQHDRLTLFALDEGRIGFGTLNGDVHAAILPPSPTGPTTVLGDDAHDPEGSIVALGWLQQHQAWAIIRTGGVMRFSNPALVPTDFGVSSDEGQQEQGLEHAWIGSNGRCVLVLRDALQCFQICDDGSCEERWQTSDLDAAVTRLSVNPRGDRAALALGDRLEVLALSDDDASRLHDLRGHDRPIRAVWIAADGDWLASVSEDGLLCLWGLPDPEPLLRLLVPLVPDQDAGLRMELDGAWQSRDVLWLAVRVSANNVYVIRLDARSAARDQAFPNDVPVCRPARRSLSSWAPITIAKSARWAAWRACSSAPSAQYSGWGWSNASSQLKAFARLLDQG